MQAGFRNPTKPIVALVALVALAVAGAEAAAHFAKAGGGPQPRVIQLSYSEVNDGSTPRLRLMAFARRTDSVRLTTRYEGTQATAGTR